MPPATLAALMTIASGSIHAVVNAIVKGGRDRMTALRETGMVTALLIAVVWLGERVTVQRASAVVGILAGAALIWSDSSIGRRQPDLEQGRP